jgi:4-aminobutyrate aminotransferase-like enzyme
VTPRPIARGLAFDPARLDPASAFTRCLLAWKSGSTGWTAFGAFLSHSERSRQPPHRTHRRKIVLVRGYLEARSAGLPPLGGADPANVPAFVSGEGSFLVDHTGRRYLDFSSQLVFTNVGHQHPRVVSAIKEQADRLCTLAPTWVSDVRGEAAKMIVDVAPAGLNRVMFTNGGTEAIEHATRMARVHTGRPKLLAAYRSYHGSTTTSMHLTGDHRRWATDTGAAGVVHFFGPYLYRSAFGSSTPSEECERALGHLEHVIALEGPSTIAALVLKSVIGGSGVIPPPPGYLEGVRELCTKHGIVYIADEVLVGFGRTGEWFGVDHARVSPDLMAFAKGVNSGYVPLGGILVGDPIYETFMQRPYPGGLRYGGHPSPVPRRSARCGRCTTRAWSPRRRGLAGTCSDRACTRSLSSTRQWVKCGVSERYGHWNSSGTA